MSSRHLLPRVKEDAHTTSEEFPIHPPVDQPMRTGTMARQLHAVGGSRRRSFLSDLQEQVQKHKEDDLARERQYETLHIHRILQRLPENRDASDIDTLYDWVMRNGSTIKIFQGAQEIICKTICREMTLLELPAKGVVCYQGDYGDVFFIIIAGSVSLYVETKKKLALLAPHNGNTGPHRSNQMHSDEPPRPHERFRQQRAMSGLSDSSSAEITPDMYGTFIKHIGAGGTFGELAVMDPTARRSCTIFCDSPTSFICLKRAAYQRLIRIANSSQLDFTQVEFLETLYVFEKWPHAELLRLSNRLRHMTFPADTHLARISSEANLVFFIYSGIVQETIPLVHHLNDNGDVAKCTTLESDAALRITYQEELTVVDRKRQQQRRRVALEVNVFQEHDICGEFPIVFNKPTSNTDLLAVTDVKVLIMDRETWREVFFMHGLDHVRESHRRFRQLAQARETWRQARLKLELANPGLHITLSTKAMMQDGQCMCGWCGSREHITGDYACPSLVASKQKQADKQKQRDAEKEKTASSSSPSPTGGRRTKTPTRGHTSEGINARATVVKNTLTFVNQLHEKVSHRNTSTVAIMDESVGGFQATNVTSSVARPTTPRTSITRTSTPRQSALRTAAQRIMSEKNQSQPNDEAGEPRPLSPQNSPVVAQATDLSHRKRAIVTTTSLADVMRTHVSIDILQAARKDDADASVQIVPPKVDEVRKGFFTDELSQEYRHALVGKAKRITSVQQFYDTREKLLEQIQQQDGERPQERHQRKVPRKPKIPKPSRRLAMCSKTREPRPDRFNRKINRVLKKMWKQDHPVPVVEESLRDT